MSPTTAVAKTPSGRKPAKKRPRFSPYQVECLLKVFSYNPLPNSQQREELARQLETTPDKLRIWFQNKRAEQQRKRKARLSQLACQMQQPQTSSLTGQYASSSSLTTPTTPYCPANDTTFRTGLFSPMDFNPMPSPAAAGLGQLPYYPFIPSTPGLATAESQGHHGMYASSSSPSGHLESILPSPLTPQSAGLSVSTYFAHDESCGGYPYTPVPASATTHMPPTWSPPPAMTNRRRLESSPESQVPSTVTGSGPNDGTSTQSSLSARTLRVGSWQYTTEGQDELVCHWEAQDQRLVWTLHSPATVDSKMIIALDTVSLLDLHPSQLTAISAIGSGSHSLSPYGSGGNSGNTDLQGELCITLQQSPTFYQTQVPSHQWALCGDFTVDLQATSVLTHQLIGNYWQLHAELRELVMRYPKVLSKATPQLVQTLFGVSSSANPPQSTATAFGATASSPMVGFASSQAKVATTPTTDPFMSPSIHMPSSASHFSFPASVHHQSPLATCTSSNNDMMLDDRAVGSVPALSLTMPPALSPLSHAAANDGSMPASSGTLWSPALSIVTDCLANIRTNDPSSTPLAQQHPGQPQQLSSSASSMFPPPLSSSLSPASSLPSATSDATAVSDTTPTKPPKQQVSPVSLWFPAVLSKLGNGGVPHNDAHPDAVSMPSSDEQPPPTMVVASTTAATNTNTTTAAAAPVSFTPAKISHRRSLSFNTEYHQNSQGLVVPVTTDTEEAIAGGNPANGRNNFDKASRQPQQQSMLLAAAHQPTQTLTDPDSGLVCTVPSGTTLTFQPDNSNRNATTGNAAPLLSPHLHLHQQHQLHSPSFAAGCFAPLSASLSATSSPADPNASFSQALGGAMLP
ncbi:hypothetical protein H4R34_002854 [Dimargaris verticillata]|uniref:Homeobox domain-containing protein n=1 Tax=Dimargaris verticillata TaxID=2761393 RepID=A0A9W8B794_9FUNG|nr:hypothetical protein H4R34_002854 [Dimargaris verticillata]